MPKIDQTTATVLSVLLREAGSGRDVIKRAAERGERLSEGTIYPRLRALEAEGFLSCSTTEPLPERGGRRKFVYKTTGLGSTALNDYRDRVETQLGWIGRSAVLGG